MANKARTGRGFRIFKECKNDLGPLKVLESSKAFEGPHARIYLGDKDHVECDVQGAKDMIEGLRVFIVEAEANELTEKIVDTTDK